MKRLRALLPLLLLIATGAVLFFSGALRHLDPRHLVADHAQLRHLATASPWLARLSYLGIMVLAVASGMPGLVLITIAGGLIFGLVESTVLSTLGLVLGSLLLFLAARYALGAGERPAPLLAEKIRAGFLGHPASYTLFLRLVPVFPFGGVTLGLAWLRCPLWLFMAATAAGGMVLVGFESAVGAGLSEAMARGEPIGVHMVMEWHILLPLCALAILALVPVLLGRRGQSSSGKGSSGKG
jgi:uncharacterized membrane protein YdjX (TVP38/TMEM64 family)